MKIIQLVGKDLLRLSEKCKTIKKKKKKVRKRPTIGGRCLLNTVLTPSPFFSVLLYSSSSLLFATKYFNAAVTSAANCVSDDPIPSPIPFTLVMNGLVVSKIAPSVDNGWAGGTAERDGTDGMDGTDEMDGTDGMGEFPAPCARLASCSVKGYAAGLNSSTAKERREYTG